jgi:hypothetical protein
MDAVLRRRGGNEPGARRRRLPFRARIVAHVGAVAQQLDRLIVGVEQRHRRRDRVGEAGDPAGLEHARGLAQRRIEAAPVMHAVLWREGGARTFNHPADGFLRFEQVTFDLASRPKLKLTILVPKT